MKLYINKKDSVGAKSVALDDMILTADLPDPPPYLRVLGMTDSGAAILHRAKPALPYVMRPADVKKLSPDARHIFELEAAADDFYSLCTEVRRPAGLDYTEKLIRL